MLLDYVMEKYFELYNLNEKFIPDY